MKLHVLTSIWSFFFFVLLSASSLFTQQSIKHHEQCKWMKSSERDAETKNAYLTQSDTLVLENIQIKQLEKLLRFGEHGTSRIKRAQKDYPKQTLSPYCYLFYCPYCNSSPGLDPFLLFSKYLHKMISLFNKRKNTHIRKESETIACSRTKNIFRQHLSHYLMQCS